MTEKGLHQVMELESELKERQEAFIRRERVYRMRLEELKGELDTLRRDKTSWMRGDRDMQRLREAHGEILEQAIQGQESKLLGAFRGKLHDVQRELAAERAKKDDGVPYGVVLTAAAWIAKSHGLEDEADAEKARADRLDRANRVLGGENGRLKRQFECQEDDRAYLVRQLVAVKEENETLRAKVKEKREKLMERDGGRPGVLSDDTKLPTLAPAPAAESPKRLGNDADGTYRDMVAKLSRALQLERKHIAQVKDAHAAWKAHRTPLELQLRDAVAEEARAVAERLQSASSRRRPPTPDNPDPPLDSALLAAFSHEDRARAIERWLAMDGVLDALYADEESLVSERKSGFEGEGKD